MAHELTHVDAAGHPRMVDVSSKTVSARQASARASVVFPAEVAVRLRMDGMRGRKGAVVDTAIIAGTMAVKRTHELIPFCHPLPIDGCDFAIDWRDDHTLEIDCSVRTLHRTGVEMEAMTGASVAALTVYDMCKALSHDIVIGPVRLLAKRGGKRDVGGDGGTAGAEGAA
ncbi:MAG: cyclic pyranopterin monophosphate synthase MoaC [Pseudoxanthomonas suwonensis]|nr:cyclic pyranopterin monophosphate synthase MoaC [Pseudoxanthomonas suwonensis]